MNRNIWTVISVIAVFAVGCKKSQDDRSKTTGTISATPDKPTNKTTVIRITAIPDENPSELARKYRPMVDYLANKLGVKVTYTPVTDYGAAVRALVADKVDFAWLGGFTYVLSRHHGETVPVVMRGIDKKFESAFIASTASGITGPEDLKGKTFAFGSKSSTSGRLMPQHFLQTRFNLFPKKDFKAVMFSGSHSATVKMVEGGRVQAGALNNAIWKRLNKEGKVDASKVRRIWVTPQYVDYVWTARKAVPEHIRTAFAKAFLDLDGSNPIDREVLGLQRAKQFVPANPSDFDVIENTAKSIGLLK